MNEVRDIPLSYGQRALWFLQKLAPGATAYNVSLPARARHLDAAAFRAAWQALADRHPVLRTTYPAPGGSPVGRVHQHLPVDFAEVDASTWSIEELDRRLGEEAHRPFRLEEGPVVRLRLFHCRDGETITLSSLHHISIDFSSLAILLDELGTLYDAVREGRSAPLPPAASTYEAFARWQSEMLAGPRGAELESLWRGRLADAPPVLDLPADHPRPRRQTFRGGSLDVFLPAGLTRSAKTLAAAEGVDLGTLLLTAFQALLYRYTGREDILVGCPVPGRPAPELREVIGYFVNSVVVRGDFAGEPAFRTALARVRERVEEARAWQDYPFPLLVEHLRPRRDLGVTPVFQVFFVLYQGGEERAARLLTGQGGATLRTGSLQLDPYLLGGRAAMFDLSLLLSDTGDRVTASFQYSSDLFEPATVARLADDYADLLAAVVADPGRLVATLPASLGDVRPSASAMRSPPASPHGGTEPRPGRDPARPPRSPEAVARHQPQEPRMSPGQDDPDDLDDLEGSENAIALLAMAGRFPGARDLDGFWKNLRQGVESIRTLTGEELLAAGVLPATLADPRYVRAAGLVEEIDLFDAPFFGYSAREAALLDPQQRLFLECAWEALEAAGYDGLRIDRPVGVYGGVSANSYYLFHLFSRHGLLNDPAAAQELLGSDKDFLCARISYELGLRGPSLGVQTACSTSLVAVHLACQSLLNGECDMALAGGASLKVPQVGYFHVPDSILSPDGHCRAFDAGAAGSVPGSGVGVVVLKRLEDARADGDPVRAVIRGSAVNNDGALRVGFSAPGVEGQSAVIAEALALARVDPASIGYLEAHGSGTALGDPIEIAALTRAFQAGTGRRGFCAVGSVKTNIGHLDAAAGVAGLIKTVLALEHREIPPSLHFQTPNPNIDFVESPFHVNTALVPWEAEGAPRRAGVSSFGLGGTNAHVVLEEAPEPEPSGPSRPWQLLVLSAATRTALETATDRLVMYFETHPEASLADAAWTLQAGRRVMAWRRALVCRDVKEARRALSGRDPGRLLEAFSDRTDRAVAFLLPGLGNQYPGMTRGLYDGEPVFRQEIDRCAGILRPHLGLDLREALWPAGLHEGRGGVDLKAMLGRGFTAADPLDRTAVAHSAVFAVEIALARLWREWGIMPRALLGDSLGEYAAACLAGVISLEDALRVVALRARAIEALPAGALLAVPLAESETVRLLDREGDLALAAVNGPDLCVVAGPVAAVEALEAALVERGTPGRRLAATHAFHSPLLRPVAAELARLLAGIELRAPRIPWISNVTGTWITAEEATDPEYWVRQMLSPVRLAAGLAGIVRERSWVLLEVGPGQSLSSLALQMGREGTVAVPALRPVWEERPDQAFALTALGRLWLAGVPVDWTGFRGEERRRRVMLPTYPFERKRYWVERGMEQAEDLAEVPPATTVHARPGLSTPYVAPATPAEEALAGIWQELLGVSPVGVRDSFFDLGGHSLLATQLLARISARFGVELPLTALFEAPTIAAFSPRLAARETATRPALPRRPRADRAPLSFAQQRLWFIDRLAPGNAAYNNPAAMRLRGPLDPDLLTAALTEIHRRHEILRTTFPWENGEPVQRIGDPEPAVVHRIDLPGGEVPLAVALQAAWKAIEEPFDLAARPAVRHLLVRIGRDDHLFVTAMHHILWDEWSQGIFVGELAALYEAFRAGLPSPLPELPAQYGDWALWQRDTLRGEALGIHLAYWRARLEGVPRLLALPTDRLRPAVQTFRGATRVLTLSGQLPRTLHSLAQRHGATLFMTLLAGFQALLGRYSGQDDLVVSTGTGSRGRVEAESLIGCFINILLLRADLASPASFGELLDRTRESTLGAFAHQDLPFELLVDALQVERDPSTVPLTQVMLVFLNVPPVRLRLAGDLRAEGVRIDRETAQLDLCLYLVEEEGRLGGHLEYNVDLFDAATVDRLLAHYRNLLERAADDPSRRPAEIPLLSEAERRQAIDAWNATAVDFPRDACLHELFEARAAEAPEAPALVCGEACLTYAELERRANSLAHHLIRRGARRGGRIGVSLERAPEVVVSLLAVLKAGCAYVPLDPEYPQERLALLLESADVRLLVTQERLAGRFAGFDVLPVLVDGWSEETARPPETGVSPEALVYVIFTSGSTGHPKGVLLDHRGRVNNFTDFNRCFRIGPGDAVLAVSSLSFDMSAYDILGTLAGGGTIVLPRPEELREPASWAVLLERHRVTIWHSVPALLEMLVSWLESRPEAAPRSLRLVLLGGDWIPVTLPDRLRALLPDIPAAQVISLGGATEVSMDSTIYPIGEVDPAWASIPYGVPMANQRAYVVGPGGEPNPVGVAGELLLGGAGVAQGYFGRPDLTAERFIPDPFSAEPGRRLYRTGDLARYGPDGLLELLGRLDHQVKILGVRIEPGEIAGALRRHPAVGEAVVLAREDHPGLKRIVAYLVPAPGAEIDEDEIRGFARSRLPGSMVPSAFVVLESLPLTPNRKLDRKALPAPEERREERERVPPRTPLEKVLAEIWKSVLGASEVGALESFFDLGGHSLAATRVVAQIQDVFPLEVPLRALFEAPTLAELAVRLRDLGAAAGVDVAGIAEVVLEVRDLQDDEVKALLAEERAP
jgi:amino acid adenylation domain-containing protein